MFHSDESVYIMSSSVDALVSRMTLILQCQLLSQASDLIVTKIIIHLFVQPLPEEFKKRKFKYRIPIRGSLILDI